jgi:hypothetical protein
MFAFIRSISFTVQAMIPVVALILFGVAWFLPGNLQPGLIYGNGLFYLPADGWMYTLWTGMASLPLWAQILPACITAIFIAVLLAGTDMANILMGRRSYALAFVYLLLLASGGHFFLFHPAMPATLLMVVSQRFLLALYKRETEYAIVFVMGFAWGAAALLYPPVLALAPALLLGLLLMVSTNWRHWLVCIMGLALPGVLASVCWYLLGDLSYEMRTFFSWFKLREFALPAYLLKEPFVAAWMLLLVVWTVLATMRYRNPKIQSRQLFQHNFLLFVNILVVTVLMKTVAIEFTWLLVLPLSYFMTFWALEESRGWVRDLFFFSLIAAFVFFRIRGLII